MNKLLALAATAFLVVGCGTPASYKDSNGRDLVVSLEKVDIQDFATAGSTMLQSMVNAPAFQKAGAAPVLQVGNVLNDTASNFDTSLLLTKITSPLVNAGRVRLLDSDPAAVAARKATPGAAVPVAEFVLKGKILEDRSNAGRTRQASFVFQLTLVEVKSSLAVWQDEKIVTKQGSKNSVGF
jgi:PBP1b-binding outer membrane lipoprotein LpoB